MATNKGTLKALERMNELIEELGAWNRLFKFHISAQKAQGGDYENDEYKYDPLTKEIKRFRNGEELRSL